ncbi:MAG TPA: cysteine-rich CWC family protein [Myxococcota bacterium]|jgi:hypothetical protein
MEVKLDPARCPLCAAPNACGMAAGEESCWCFEARLAPDALARIPEPARGVACICARCGGAASEPAR